MYVLNIVRFTILDAHFSESLTGIPTIRAYGMEEKFVSDNQDKLDDSIRASFISFMSQRWLSARLDFLGNLLVAAAGFLICAVKNQISGAVIGLALTYALQITGLYVLMYS